MPPRRRTAAASALGVLLAALVMAAGARPVRAQSTAQPGVEQPAVPAAAPVAPAPVPLPADLGPEVPVPTPTPLLPGQPDPRRGLQFGLGLPVVDLHSEKLGVHLRGGKPSQTGVMLQVDAVRDPFRLGYVRQLYRTDLPAGTTLDGQAVDALSVDSDQLWAFHGFRLWHSLYLAYGLGWQRRQIRLLEAGVAVRGLSESGFVGGLQADWAVALPFSLQLRLFGDLRPGLVELRVATLQLAFIAAF
ncbi:MAG TPA: hypothetical protein VKB51_02700 [bacterium]|nr:hypothetical protein [bacterium]